MNLVLAVTGATGAATARILIERSPWPVELVMTRHGRIVFEHECGPVSSLESAAAHVHDDADLAASIASGSTSTIGMVVLPCTTNTLAKVAAGLADTLVTRAAHCHLKERRRLVLAVRETPWSTIDFENAARVSAAGGVVMPFSPPYYLVADRPPESVTLRETFELFVDRVLAQFGHAPERTWESVRG
jgi:4-hydroxy-3-polyprenylbenzoate decarboxylase